MDIVRIKHPYFEAEMSKKDFYQLFIQELKDIYNAEKQNVKALPIMASAAHSPMLKEAFRTHWKETKEHVQRLKQIARILGEDLSGSECDAMRGILKEAHKSLDLNYASPVRDASLISEAQKVEHYEIATYGTLKTFAHHLNFPRVEELLNLTIKEEGNTNKKLTKIAEGTIFSKGINVKAKETITRKRRRRNGRRAA